MSKAVTGRADFSSSLPAVLNAAFSRGPGSGLRLPGESINDGFTEKGENSSVEFCLFLLPLEGKMRKIEKRK
jgi:hypothetical protein